MAPAVSTRRTCLGWASTALVLVILVAASPVASSRKLPRKAITHQAVGWYIPPPQTSFYWQLQGTINMSNSAKVFDFDGFDNSAATIAQLHAKGKRVMCYFSVGSFEDWRPDAAKFPKSVLGAKLCANMNDAGTKCLQYWPGERWLDIRSSAVRTIMKDRIKMAASKGCDGIEPDNVDAYNANTQDPQGQPITKFQISQKDEVAYLTWLSATVHKYKMSIGLKNSGDLAPSLLHHFDWALSEECNAFSDYTTSTWSAGQYQCDYLNLFTQAGKASFVAEYKESWTGNSFFPTKLCMYNNAQGFTTQEYVMDLNSNPLLNCPDHQPSGCAAATWKHCIHATVFKKYNTDPEMTDADAMGQCMRKKASAKCRYE